MTQQAQPGVDLDIAANASTVRPMRRRSAMQRLRRDIRVRLALVHAGWQQRWHKLLLWRRAIRIGFFGKHPAWADYVHASVGALPCEGRRFGQFMHHLDACLQAMVISEDYAQRQARGEVVPFDHLICYRRGRGVVVARIWESCDKGRGRHYPMVAGIECLRWSVPQALMFCVPRLQVLRELLGASTDPAELRQRIAQQTAEWKEQSLHYAVDPSETLLQCTSPSCADRSRHDEPAVADAGVDETGDGSPCEPGVQATSADCASEADAANPSSAAMVRWRTEHWDYPHAAFARWVPWWLPRRLRRLAPRRRGRRMRIAVGWSSTSPIDSSANSLGTVAGTGTPEQLIAEWFARIDAVAGRSMPATVLVGYGRPWVDLLMGRPFARHFDCLSKPPLYLPVCVE